MGLIGDLVDGDARFGPKPQSQVIFVPNDSDFGQKLWHRALAQWTPMLIGICGAVWMIIEKKWLSAFPMIVIVVLSWLRGAGQSRARMDLTGDALIFRSNDPLLSRWQDWTLDLNAVRKGDIQLYWLKNGLAGPLACELRWGDWQRSFQPMAWRMPDQPAPVISKPQSTLGLVRWDSPENQEIMQDALLTSPLIKALIESGVPLPSWSGSKPGPGIDLFRHPRIKAVLTIGFGAFLVGLLLFFLTSHQTFASSLYRWPLGLIAVGLMMLAWQWMRIEQPHHDERPALPGELQLAKRLSAVLAGGMVTAILPLLLQAGTLAAVSPKPARYVMQRLPAPHLVPEAGQPGLPVIELSPLTRAADELPTGIQVQLELRRGFRGWWWQYDMTPLTEAVRGRYEQGSATSQSMHK